MFIIFLSYKMKVLHTSDWHLGRALYGQKRYKEFSKFLDWLIITIEKEHIDVLLIAGDVFDTSMPSNHAQKLYYHFLSKVSTLCCRHIIIISGNHDSPSFLNAPKELLFVFNVYVIAMITEDLADEVIVLHNKKDQPELIVCAVPYLKDRDIRTVKPGETLQDKNKKLIDGVKNHYVKVCDIAKQKQAELEKKGYSNIPIVGMGHLFTVGGTTIDGDGVRELYVGSLAHVQKSIFPTCLDYLALGHLHVPQCVGGAEHIRYCGSPIPMGYGEANQQKKVIIIEFDKKRPLIKELEIPCFQVLERIVGSLDEISIKIEDLKKSKSEAWLEIEYTGNQIISHLWDLLEDMILGSSLEIRRVKNRRILEQVIDQATQGETLEDVDVYEVFQRFLDKSKIPSEEQKELVGSYHEIIRNLEEEDKNAE